MSEKIIHLLDKFEDEKKYWLTKLQDITEIATFPVDFENRRENEKEAFAITFDSRLTSKILHISKNNDLSLYVVLLAAFNVLAWKYSRVEDCIAASPMHVKDEKLFNRFVLLRNTVTADMSFADHLMAVKTTVSEGYKNQHYPISKVLETLGYGDREFISAALVLEGVHKIDTLDTFTGSASNRLLLSFVRSGDQLEGKAIYNSALFKEKTVRGIVKHYEIVLDWVLANIKVKLSELELVTPVEKENILYHFNRTGVEYPGPQTVHELFDAAADRYPDNIAVIFEDRVLQYRGLKEAANQWARLLREKDIKPDCTVAILLESSVEMVIAILAVLKAGGAYLPLEPNYPAQRIKDLLDDSEARVLLTISSFSDLLREVQPGIPVIYLDKEDVSVYSSSGIEAAGSSSNLAYIVYTSGTTGTPRGVMVEHKGLVNYTLWRIHAYNYTSEDVSLQVLSYVFDGFMSNFYTSLLSGGALVMIPSINKMDIDYLKEKIKEHRVTNMSLVPGLYKALIDNADGQYLRSMRFVVLAGEKADSQLIRGSSEKIPGILHIIEYGPTEATVTAAANIGIEPDETALIGKPIANAAVYILDDSLKLLPVGITGEIYIGGKGVSRGYLKHDALTSLRFIENPFESGGRLYRTGDLGRWTDDGKIEFLGRVDLQVKIGGIRIEPEEIKNCLLTHDSVLEAEVLYGENPDGNKYLYAFFVSRERLSEAELRDYLGKHLPHYMVPAYLIPLDKMPLTPNGKLDRKALEGMNLKMNRGMGYDKPRNAVEEKLVEVLQGILGIDHLGINDNFFENGGDSIKAVQAATRMHKFGLKVETADFFINPVIKDLAKHVKPLGRAIHQGIVEGKVELTPIQQWFFEENFTDNHYFNQAVLLRRKKGFDPGIVEKLFTRLTAHHDILRMVFTKEDNRFIQVNRGVEPGMKFYDLEVIDLSGKTDISAEIETHAVRIHRSIDYTMGPLVKLGLFKTASEDYLLIVIHFLVVDEVSWRILLEDIGFGLQKLEKGESFTFLEKTHSYIYWADRLVRYAVSYPLLKELESWKGIERRSFKPLPYDHDVEIGDRKRKNRDFVVLELDEEKTVDVLKKANWPYNTVANDLLLAALALAVKDWAGIEAVPVELESHGRERISAEMDIDRTVGPFTSRFPLCLDIAQSPGISSVIKIVKEALRCIPNNGVGYGILKYLTPEDKKEGVTFQIEPEIRFNLLGEFDIDFGMQKQSRHRDQEEFFDISDLYTGEEVSPESELKWAFDISVYIKNRKLSLKFQYNKRRYERKTVEKLIESYRSRLFEIVEYCMGKKAGEYTPYDLAPGENLSIDDLDKLKEVLDINNIAKIYSLSPMQEGMLFHSLREKNSRMYFEQNVFTLKGNIDPATMEGSIKLLARRHETFRTVFYCSDVSKPLQIVLTQLETKMGFKDISSSGGTGVQETIKEFLARDREEGFDLFRGGALTRFFLFKTGPASYELIFTFHHALLDGWCEWIIANDLVAFYRSLSENRSVELEQPAPYKNYIDWLKIQDRREGEIYWRNYLHDYNRENLILKFGKTGKNGKHESVMHTFTIDRQMNRRLVEMSRENQVTINSIFQVVWGIMLQKYNYVDDVVFGQVVAGRPPEIDGIEMTVGLFLNTIPVRVKVENEKTFLDLLKTAHHKMVLSKPHEYLPLTDIQALSPLKRNVFDHILTFAPTLGRDRYKELNSNEYLEFAMTDRKMFHHSSFDFNLVIYPGEDVTTILLIYNPSVYEFDFIMKIEKYLVEVLSQVLMNPAVSIEDIKITLEITRSTSAELRNDGGDFEF